MIRAIGRAAAQHEAAVAIAAIDIAVLIDFQPDAWVAKGGTGANIGRAVAFDARGIGVDDFRRLDHGLCVTNARRAFPA